MERLLREGTDKVTLSFILACILTYCLIYSCQIFNLKNRRQICDTNSTKANIPPFIPLLSRTIARRPSCSPTRGPTGRWPGSATTRSPPRPSYPCPLLHTTLLSFIPLSFPSYPCPLHHTFVLSFIPLSSPSYLCPLLYTLIVPVIPLSSPPYPCALLHTPVLSAKPLSSPSYPWLLRHTPYPRTRRVSLSCKPPSPTTLTRTSARGGAGLMGCLWIR